MSLIKRLMTSLAGYIILANIIGGCSGEQAKQLVSSIPTATNPTVGEVTDDSMYVRVYDSGKFVHSMSNRADPKTDCSIKKGSTSQIITCDLRLNEFDLYVNPLSLQLNVPKGMCEYVGTLPYFYYNYEPGASTGNVAIDLSTLTPTCTTSDVGRTATFANDTCTVSEGTRKIYEVTSTGGAKSAFDYTSDEGPNCATGTVKATITKKQLTKASITAQGVTYEAKTAGAAGNSITITLTSGGTAGSEVVTVSGKAISVQIASGVTTQAQLKTKLDLNVDSAALISTTVTSGTLVAAAAVSLANGTDKEEFKTEQKFTGSYASCLSGPAINSMEWPKSSSGWPLQKITTVSDAGVNDLIKMKSNLEIGRSSSVNLANGYNYQNLFLGGSAVYSSAPQIFRPLSTAPATTNPFYSWYCYDANGEVRYGIKLAIQEFNTKAEFLKWYNSTKINTAIANPDVTGAEGTACDSIATDNVCNDFSDIDDMISVQFPKEKAVF